MVKRCKGLNSKCFLFTYLLVVGFLLVLWLNKLPVLQKDTRPVPQTLSDVIVSPAQPLPDFSLKTNKKLMLTPDDLLDKWTFVYFSFSHCLPACQTALVTLKGLRRNFSSQDIQFLVISIDAHDTVQELAFFLKQQGIDAIAATGDKETVEELTKSFVALYLQTDFSDGSYMIEQKHNLFLVDPKGRRYADFKAPYSVNSVESKFIQLRRFYARTE